MKELIDIVNGAAKLKAQTLELNNLINSLKHPDVGVSLHINNLKIGRAHV